jgi:hypothetical protein
VGKSRTTGRCQGPGTRTGGGIADLRLTMDDCGKLRADCSRLARAKMRCISNGRFQPAPTVWLTCTLLKVRNGALSLRDGKNEGRPGYVHEKTGEGTKCLAKNKVFYTRMRKLRDTRQESSGLFVQNAQITP